MTLFAALAMLSACGPSKPAEPHKESAAPAAVVTAAPNPELEACMSAYANRMVSPEALGKASTTCNTAYYDLPVGSHDAAVAKAMHDAADARLVVGATPADRALAEKKDREVIDAMTAK